MVTKRRQNRKKSKADNKKSKADNKGKDDTNDSIKIPNIPAINKSILASTKPLPPEEVPKNKSPAKKTDTAAVKAPDPNREETLEERVARRLKEQFKRIDPIIPEGFLRACIDRPGSRPPKEWSCEIKFPARDDGNDLKNVNILKQVGKRSEKFSKRGKKHVSIYFCEEQYPSSDGFNSGAFAKLFKDIQLAAASQGIQLIRNGRYRWMGKQAMKICCTRALCYRPTPNRRATITSWENATKNLHHDDDDDDPIKPPVQSRKSSTKRAFSLDKKCKFFFLIYFDEKGFFVVPGSGNPTHCNHPKANEENAEEKKKKKQSNLVDTIPFSNWLPELIVPKEMANKSGLPPKTPDIHFHCPDGTIIHAHKLILSAASEHFKELFGDKDKKWEKEHPDNVWKVDFTSDQMQMFISYMYTGEVTPKLLQKSPHSLLPVVYKFKLTKMVKAIEDILMKSVEVNTIKQVLVSATRHELVALKLYCHQYVRYNMAKVLTNKEFVKLSTEHPDIWDQLSEFLLDIYAR